MLSCAGEGNGAAWVLGEVESGGRSKDKHLSLGSCECVSVAGTGCVGIRCSGSLAQIMRELLPKYVFCQFSFSWVKDFFSPKATRFFVHLPLHLTVGRGGKTAVEGTRSEET